jgi:hypothetical protein
VGAFLGCKDGAMSAHRADKVGEGKPVSERGRGLELSASTPRDVSPNRGHGIELRFDPDHSCRPARPK